MGGTITEEEIMGLEDMGDGDNVGSRRDTVGEPETMSPEVVTVL